MIQEICLIFTCIVMIIGLATFIDWIVKKWSARPIKETNEGPHFYAVKELYDEKNN